jgi:hypothetical protein
MTDSPQTKAADALRAALAAKHRAAAKGGPPGRGGRESERDAAARSAAKSKPAMRK